MAGLTVSVYLPPQGAGHAAERGRRQINRVELNRPARHCAERGFDRSCSDHAPDYGQVSGRRCAEMPAWVGPWRLPDVSAQHRFLTALATTLAWQYLSLPVRWRGRCQERVVFARVLMAAPMPARARL